MSAVTGLPALDNTVRRFALANARAGADGVRWIGWLGARVVDGRVVRRCVVRLFLRSFLCLHGHC